MEERRPGGEDVPPETETLREVAPPTVEHYRLIERAHRMDTTTRALQVARETVADLRDQHGPVLRTVQSMAETAEVLDAGARRNAATALEFADVSGRLAERLRELVNPPAPVQRPGALEVLTGGMVEITKSLFGGQGKELIETAKGLLSQLAAGALPEEMPAGAAGAPTMPPPPGEEAPRRAPAGPGELPDLGVLFQEVPAELQGLTLEEMRAALIYFAKLKAQQQGG